MSNAPTLHTGGPGFFGMLGILFIALKLTGVISWSWWYVLAPLWGPLAFLLVCGIMLLIAGGIYFGLKGLFK